MRGWKHESTAASTHDWLTPPWILEALGPFDLDPCASKDQPWATATTMYTEHGLEQPWDGMVWCNPPYGNQAWRWLERLAAHQNGIALVFARTETHGFFDQVWGRADAILFMKGRLRFRSPVTGEPGGSGNAGAPSVLIGYGNEAVARLQRSQIPGALVTAPWVVKD